MHRRSKASLRRPEIEDFLQKSRRSKSRKVSRRSVRRSQPKRSKGSLSKKNDKIRAYFKRFLKKEKEPFLGSVWEHPVTKKYGKIPDSARKIYNEVKKEMKISGTRCKVAKSRTNKKEDLIKEIRGYVNCYERKTKMNQDLPMSRLKGESVAQLKKHLSFYRSNNKY